MNLLHRLFQKYKTKQKIIMVGTAYANFQWCEQRVNEGLIEVVAFIDEEPWNHKTTLLNAPLKYPSELIALCKKHKVNKVVVFTNSTIQLSKEQQNRLHELGVQTEFISDLAS